MTSFFVSSVVSGFEEYRMATKSAIELQGGRPVMSEYFGAREYSSEKACLLEIEQSDVFILVLGHDYGYITTADISVTEAEFRHAQSLNKKVLVFIQKTSMDERQTFFRTSVENYSDGFFRASFTNSSELKDEVVRGIAQLNASLSANSEAEFKATIDDAMGSARRYNSDKTYLRIAYLPQPIKQLHLPQLDQKDDAYFTKMCAVGLGQLRDGYKVIEEGHRESFMGIETKYAKLKLYESGLTLIEINNLSSSTHTFATFTISPSKVSAMSKAAINLMDANSIWCHLGLFGIDNKSFQEIDEGKNSFSLASSGTDEICAYRLFQPINTSNYEAWVGATIATWQRKLQG
jgi:hypothetical protein